MKCVCCQSGKIKKAPLNLEGYNGCGSCGLIFKSRIDEQVIHEEYREHYGQHDPHRQVARSKQHFFDHALDLLSKKIAHGNKTLLDVGCGYGYFLERAAARGWKIYGVEIAENAVQGAGKRLFNAAIFHGVLEEAGHPENTFDAVTLWDLLDFVKDPYKELRECCRVLKNGGMVGIRVRNVQFQKFSYRMYACFKPVAWILKIKPPYVFHPYCFTGQSLVRLLERSGFSHIRVGHSPLTRGDPYAYTGIKGMTGLIKGIVEAGSKLVFLISGGRWVVGPSLLVWAEKRETY